MVDNVRHIVAIEWLAAAQAIEFHAPLASSPPLERVRAALRERVAEMLTKDTRVKQFRLGAWNEGGAGVTVAEL